MKKNLILLITEIMLAVTMLSGCVTETKSNQFSDDETEIADNYFVDKENGQTAEGETNDSTDKDINDENTVNDKYDILIVSETDGLNVRKGPSTSYSSLGTLDEGDMASFEGIEGNWYKTIYKQQEAYVSVSYCSLAKFEKGSQQIEDIICVGKTLLGHPYVWGSERYLYSNGTINKNFKQGEFDCSALTQYAYYIGAGIKLDVTTRTQVLQGNEVELSDLKRGDLMFFTNSSRYYNTGIERVGHVAIYLGNNYILHTASDHAVIEEISSTRWNYFITAKRFI